MTRRSRRARVVVGRFWLGPQAVELVATATGNGGHVVTKPPTPGPAVVTVACADSWPVVVGLLVHELGELALRNVGGEYIPAVDEACATDGYAFMFNHAQFGEAAARVGALLAVALPAFRRAYRAVHRAER